MRAPPQAISPATRKKRAPRPISEASVNGSRAIERAPAAMVNTLYGIGEKPAMNTAQKPHCPNHSTAFWYAGQYRLSCNQGSSASMAKYPIA